MGVDAAIMRGRAERAADIAAGVERGESGRECCGGTAGGAAGGPREIPGIAGGAVDRVGALPVRQHFRDIGFAEDDRAGLFEFGNDRGVVIRDIVTERFATPAGRQAGDVEAFLQCHRDAEQGREPVRRTPGFVRSEERRVGKECA